MLDLHFIEVISNMRDEDRCEVMATLPLSWAGDVEGYLVHCIKRSKVVQNFYYEGRPVTTLAVLPLTHNVWNGASWSTDEWPRVVNQVTRYIRRDIPRLVSSMGCKMIDVWSLSERTNVNRWLTLCHFVFKYPVRYRNNVFSVYRMEL